MSFWWKRERMCACWWSVVTWYWAGGVKLSRSSKQAVGLLNPLGWPDFHYRQAYQIYTGRTRGTPLGEVRGLEAGLCLRNAHGLSPESRVFVHREDGMAAQVTASAIQQPDGARQPAPHI
jgi:hypothetical protein